MQMNPRLSGLRCIRCERLWPVADYPEGCPGCLEAGHPASLECRYEPGGDAAMPLPVLDPVTLGEGATPCLAAPALAQAEGVGRMWLKCESANPTGSHKDRMAAQLVSRARLAGATLKEMDESARQAVRGMIRGAQGGVQVGNVARDSRAWNSGLRPGDIIVASSSGEFGDLPGFRASFERKPAQLVLNILRGRGTGRLLMQ